MPWFHRTCRAAIYAWAGPTSLPGLALALAARLSGGGVQLIDGVLEAYGGLAAVFLRRATLLKGGASAMTLGHVVLGLDRPTLDQTRKHERVHVRQCERWGPLFIPAYLIAAAWAACRGRGAYYGNPFEREAYHAE